MLWSGWGDPAQARELPAQIRALLHDLLGVRAPAAPAATLESVRLHAASRWSPGRCGRSRTWSAPNMC